MHRAMRIAAKFTIALLVCLLLALALRSYAEVRTETEEFLEDVGEQQTLIGRALRPAVLEVWRTDGREHAMRIINEADERLKRTKRAEIRWVAISPGVDLPPPRAPLDQLRTLEQGEPAVWMLNGGTSSGQVFSYVPLDRPGEPITALEVSQQLGRRAEVERGALKRSLFTAAGVMGVAATVTGVLGIWLVGRPLRALIAQARRIGTGDLSYRISLRQDDEIGALSAEMNRMSERILESQQTVTLANRDKLRAIEALRHADRLATVGRLAAGLAHELGTPLNVVQARARSIADGSVPFETAQAHARIVVEQTERMTRLMRQLLDFARKRPLHKERTDLGAVARRALGLLGHLADKRGVTLGLDCPEALHANVDSAQMEQVVTNLLSNGLQASAEGQRVDITVGRAMASRDTSLTHEDSPESACVFVEVVDRGPGIAAADLPQIFEPFFTTKEVGEGTGLGLSVAYGIVEDHGGWIEVESDAGKGSRFRVLIPQEAP
jgi:two-component system NtrC family sensor kinase